MSPAENPATLTITRPDDWHVHLRDGAMLRAVAGFTAERFGRAIVMPNLTPPVLTQTDALAYRARIMAALPVGSDFAPLMTCYLTDGADADDIARGFKEGVFTAVKLYPAHATTNSAHGVTNLAKVRPVLARMEKIGMPLLLHGEVTDSAVDIFDREAVYIERVLQPMLADFPGLKVILEHITTAEAADFITERGGTTLAATITAHHLMINRNALFHGGLRPHMYCLPVAKREHHRLALRRAAVSGHPAFFLGTDTAPHRAGDKEADCGCAGIFNAPAAIELYAQVFEEEGALDKLEAFASFNGPDFYGLPRNRGTLTLVREDWTVPAAVPAEGGGAVKPFMGGENLRWRLRP